MDRELQQASKEMYEEDRRVNLGMMNGMYEMYNMIDQLPDQLVEKGMRLVISSDPFDVVSQGVRSLSVVKPNITYVPLGGSEKDRVMADEIERALLFQWNLMNRRGLDIQKELLLQSILYDRVCATLVHLPTQRAATGKQKINSESLGQFTCIPRDPRSVHPRQTDSMLEAVFYHDVRPAHEVISFWGKDAKKLKRAMGNKKNDGFEYVTYMEYYDLDKRMVWAVPQNSRTDLADPLVEGILIVEGKNELPFLPWVVKDGGKELTPLLWSIWQSGQWKNKNILESMSMDEIIAYYAAPRIKKSGPNTDSIEYDFGEPGNAAHVPPGHDLDILDPPRMDESLLRSSDRRGAEMQKSTVEQVTPGNIPSNIGFATLNIVAQSGVQAFAPYTKRAEDTMAELMTMMLRYVESSGENMTALSRAPKSPDAREGLAEEIIIRPGDFDVNNIFIEIELKKEDGLSEIQQINGVNMLLDKGLISKRTALQKVNVHDPEAEREVAQDEILKDSQFQVGIQLQQQDALFEQQLVQNQRMFEQQMAQQQQMQQLAQQQQQPQPQGANGQPSLGQELAPGSPGQEEATRRRGQGFEGAQGGSGFVPAQGGAPPATVNPAGTREQQQQIQGR